MKNLKKNIIRSYIIGLNINFFKKQLTNKVNYFIAHNLKNSIIQILKDIKFYKKKITLYCLVQHQHPLINSRILKKEEKNLKD